MNTLCEKTTFSTRVAPPDVARGPVWLISNVNKVTKRQTVRCHWCKGRYMDSQRRAVATTNITSANLGLKLTKMA
ncbi:uncharacterized protein LOC143902911 isoform X2 [Temnothorax americanus]|uniref:uncharacterized protein LOC143902911 isoform X2 n=1 Tax=Temnothorax americanus TaxID=1964332 RepID=UPI004069255E